MKHRELPSAELLNDLFIYDPETGLVRYRKDTNRTKAGEIVGGWQAGKYLICTINKLNYALHRIIWKMVTGDDPQEMEIDHVDGTGSNRWSNLRLATASENLRNRPMHRRNSTGYKGVTFSKKEQMFKAQIGFRKRVIHLGFYDDPKAAHLAYMDAALRFHGKFARFQ